MSVDRNECCHDTTQLLVDDLDKRVWELPLHAIKNLVCGVTDRDPNYGLTAVYRHADSDRLIESQMGLCIREILDEVLGVSQCDWLSYHPMIPANVFRHALVMSPYIPEIEQRKVHVEGIPIVVFRPHRWIGEG
jgi:hypothetical protein